MKTDALISVIVPAYNVEAYLPGCLDSILAQSYPAIEILVVDDGATDASGRIADAYAQKHPGRVLSIRTENRGVSSARLTGVERARGDWIGFVDGDDRIEPDMYERLMANAVQYRADISHCGYRSIVNDGERVHWFYNTGRLVEQDRLAGVRDLLTGDFVEPSLWNKLFRKTLFDSLLQPGFFDRSIRLNEDLLMNYDLFSRAERSVYEDFCPYLYIARASSVTRAGVSAEKLFDTVKVRRLILESVPHELEDLAWSKLLIANSIVYGSIYVDSRYRAEAKETRRFLLQNKGKWGTLPRKERLKLAMRVYAPACYSFLYGVYEKYFQNKVYE